MRGLIFNNLLEYIESEYGYRDVDTVLSAALLAEDGSYADGGMYKDADFIHLLHTASEVLKTPVPRLQESLGKDSFRKMYQKLISIYTQDSYKLNEIKNAFDFIAMLEYIHYIEVVKLYPDSTFPHFDVIVHNDFMIEILYSSERYFPYLAKGFLEGCIEYFDEALLLEIKEDISNNCTHFIVLKESV